MNDLANYKITPITGGGVNNLPSTELRIIKQQEVLGKDFRIFGTVDEPLFLAKDVAEWIEHSNTRVMIQNIDEAEKKCVNNPYALQGQQDQWFLTEDGLYEVLMQSRLPIAKVFKNEVKAILKSIRKHGAYVAPAKLEEIMNDPDAWIKVLTALKEERTAKEHLQLEAKKNEPKVLFADAVEASKTSILIGDLAKLIRQNGIEMGQNRLFDWLRENGFLIKYGQSRNMPTQRAMELELFEVKERTIYNPDGSILITRTTKVTGKGQTYFISKFLGGVA